MNRPKILELDLVRAIAIMAVVMIHATASSTILLKAETDSYNLLFILNRMSLFAVFLFIMISGTALFYRYYDSWNWRDAGRFYWKRLWSAVLPYVLWSLFYYGLKLITGVSHTFSLRVFGGMLLSASAAYHLYFMLIIIQFYLLFPLLITLIKRFPRSVDFMPLIGLVLYGAFYFASHRYVTVPHTPRLFITYMAYFMIGGWIGVRYDRFRAWVTWRPWLPVSLAVLSGSFYVYLYYANQSSVVFSNLWFVFAQLIYTVFLGAALLVLGRMAKQGSRSYTLLLMIGQASFGIYLVHPVILALFRKIPVPGAPIQYVLYTLSSFAVVFALSFLLSYGYRKLPIGKKGKRTGRPAQATQSA